ncbi:poly(ADP-ribose) polymerase catalytic domain protein [Clostridioides difficile CD160]|nr:poly(ADP-ribose) polymerase catalytic domain protein [Clostridioides difficile CD160]
MQVNFNPINGDSFYKKNYDVLEQVTLNFFEPNENKHKYYIAEIHRNNTDEYRCFINYGRIGSKGIQRATTCRNLQDSKNVFEEKISSKIQKGYVQLDMANTTVGSTVAKTKVNKNSLGNINYSTNTKQSDLSPAVIDFVSKIYEEANQAVSLSISGSLKSDIKKPLGNLGVQGINKGRDILRKTMDALENNNIKMVRELSIYYFKYIPRKISSNVRDENTWILNSRNRIKKEMDILDLYEDALRLLPVMSISDIDMKYKKLDCLIRAVKENSDEMSYIKSKIKNSHAANHSFKLKIISAFRIKQKNAPQFNSSVGNVVNLFHGSRNANLVGILSSYLKLPQHVDSGVVRSGQMFGNGIYTASKCTKSALYSFGTWQNRPNKHKSAFLFIAEVALGNVYEVDKPTQFIKPPIGYNSVKAVRGTYLKNTEFIVYNTNQIRLRYIVEIEKIDY